MKLETSTVQVELPISYFQLFKADSKPLLILLHGYTDSAQAFLRRAYPVEESEYEVLAINGLFPSPVRIEGGWKRAFSWYFADFSTNSVVIHPEVSASAIIQLLKKLGLEDREKTLVGFSQGGFFLPYLFPKLKKLRRMIGIGAAYKIENYPEGPLPIPLDAIHGTEDEIVSFKNGHESFESLKVKNPNGRFYSVSGLKHTMNDEAREIFKSLIQK